MLRTVNLTKRYGTILALDRLTLSIPDGSIMGLVGPNGSGKSTLFKLLMGLVFPDLGSIELGGVSTNRIGYMPDRPFLPIRLSCREYLSLVARICSPGGTRHHEAAAAGLAMVGLTDAARMRIGALSKGMAQRLALAAALMNDPPLLLLDEPMSGLDPGQQFALRSIIETVHRQGKTILLSTHRLSEVSSLCTHVAILKKGRLVFSGALSDVLTPSRQVAIKVDRIPAELAGRLCAGYPDLSIARNTITLTGELLDRKSEILRLLLENGCDIQQLSSGRTGLEEIYLEATRA